MPTMLRVMYEKRVKMKRERFDHERRVKGIQEIDRVEGVGIPNDMTRL